MATRRATAPSLVSIMSFVVVRRGLDLRRVVAHRVTRGLGIAQFSRERPLKQTLARAAGRRSLALQCRDCLHE